jgi:hypothetical protein
MERKLMLTTAIPLVTTNDPAAKYAEIAATLAPGAKYVQEFDYTTVENPKSIYPRYLEDIYPTATITDADGDLDSWTIAQSALGACGTFANIAGYASIPKSSPWAIENGIYPLTPSPIGLYFVRICDPLDYEQVTWVAIDSQMPCNSPTGSSAFISIGAQNALLPCLLTKAAATVRGGCFDEITNHPKLKLKFTWFPSETVAVTTFEAFKAALERGGIYVTSMAQQYDAAGNKITPVGVVYGHAWAVVAAIDGPDYQLVRLENPWAGGADLVTDYAEDSPFWAVHPELAEYQAQAKASKGNYWVDWATLGKLTGKNVFNVVCPIAVAS